MKKRVFIVHGWEGYPEEGWFPWLKIELEKKDFEVHVPALPNSNTPLREEWVPFLSKTVGVPDKNCYFVGHSLGCITILRYLENLPKEQKIAGVVLVAGFGENLNYEGYGDELKSFFETPLNWVKVKETCKNFVAIQSDNDPWVPTKFGRQFKELLGAELTELPGMHFSGSDGVMTLSSALEAVLELVEKNE